MGLTTRDAKPALSAVEMVTLIEAIGDEGQE